MQSIVFRLSLSRCPTRQQPLPRVLNLQLSPLSLSPALRVRAGLIRLGWTDGRDLPACLIDYGAPSDAAAPDAPFDPAWFPLLDIACPPAVARSVPKRQAEYLFGRLAAARVLGQLGATRLTVGTGARREPLWPAGWRGSISHTKRYALAVAAREGAWGGLGVDVEHVVNAAQAEAIVCKVINPGERERLQVVGEALPEPRLQTLVFSAKECFYKAAYGQVGDFFGFDAADVVWVDSARQRLGLRVNLALGRAFAPGQTVEIGFGLVDADTVVTWLALP